MRLDIDDFEIVKKKYNNLNDTFKEKLIFHVGTGAGFYSEIGSMLECMLYCYYNKIRFELYADDANFSDNRGWEEFFEPFCTLNHDNLNKVANYRFKNYYRWKKFILPKLLFRRVVFPYILKKRNNAKLLTQDVFSKFVSKDFKGVEIDWPELGIHGKVRDIYAHLNKLALRYNDRTWKEISKLILNLNLPKEYVSIQIRGGDKIKEFTELIDVEYCINMIDKWGLKIKNLFVFTDDYRNIIKLQKLRPEWNIYTLTRKEERGYYNSEFNNSDWEYKRSNLIKLFAMVEICINSNLHLGCSEACVNGYIRSAKKPEQYKEFTKGERKRDSLLKR